jgi:hypothetical protein
MGTIGEWYQNRTGTGWDVPGRDWRDDDRPDQGPDSWLDRATTERPRNAFPKAARSGRPGSPRTGMTARRAAARVAAPIRPTAAQVEREIREIRAQRPAIDLNAMLILLRGRGVGWHLVTRDEVGHAMGLFGRPRIVSLNNGGSLPSADIHEARRAAEIRRNGGTAGRSAVTGREFSEVVRRLHGRTPGSDLLQIAAALRRMGYADFTLDSVRRSLAMSGPAPAPRAAARTDRAPARTSAAAPGAPAEPGDVDAASRARPVPPSARRRATGKTGAAGRPGAPAVCAACGVLPSLNGRCGCS